MRRPWGREVIGAPKLISPCLPPPFPLSHEEQVSSSTPALEEAPGVPVHELVGLRLGDAHRVEPREHPAHDEAVEVGAVREAFVVHILTALVLLRELSEPD